MEKITILIFTKNSEKTIYSCIDSVLQQTYANIEIIVLDNGSKDSTLKVLDWLQKSNSCIRILKMKNASLATMRKEGLQAASGEYVAFLGAEDTLYSSALQELISCMKQFDAQISFGSFLHPFYNQFEKKGCYNLEEEKEVLLLQHNFLACAMLTGKLYQRSLFDAIKFKNSMLNEEFINLELFLHCQRVATTNQLILATHEHYTLFEEKHFWKDQKSFWFHTQALVIHKKQMYKKYKTVSKEAMNELIHTRTMDYLIWESIAYAEKGATLEEISMELYPVLSSKEFFEAIDFFQAYGLAWKEMNADELLANCLLYASLLTTHLKYAQEQHSLLSLEKLYYMLFIRLFFKQTAFTDTENYLWQLREELTMNVTPEAKIINNLTL